MRSLPNLIDKYPDESLEGFLFRFALANHREVKDLELGSIRADASDEKIEKYLATISMLAGQDISKDFLFPYRWFLEGLTLPEWKNQLYTRFCPICIEQSTYHRANWSLNHHTYCFKHLIYLIENCSYCHKQIKIEDVTKGKCGFCNYLLMHSPAVGVNKEKEYITEDGEFKELGSIYLSHSLNKTDQLYLTRWLAYYLVDKTELFNLNLDSTEKQRLAKGYYHDVVLQRKFLSLAHDLLSAWPSKLVIFLRIHFIGSYNKVKEFMFKFVYSMPHDIIKNFLWKVHEREGGYNDIRFEHQYYDHNFLFLEDLLEINSIPEEILHRVIKKYQIDLSNHPRNNLKIIHADYIPIILSQVSKNKRKIEFISASTVAKRWNVSTTTAKLVCEMFEVPIKIILEAVCFNLSILALEFESYYNKLIEGIPLESGITITKLEVATNSSTSLKQINQLHYRTKDGEEKSITAKYFVENTDFATMTSRLGLSRIQGVELVFGGAKDYMASSLMMKFKNVDWNTFKKEVNNLSRKEIEEKYGSGTTVTEMFTWGFSKVGARYKPTTSEVFLRGLNTVNQLNGEALINALLVYNVDAANPDSLQKAKELGRSETALVLQHLRKELPGWEKAELNGYPDYLYIRDYDRYETEYVLEASDLMSGKTFWDNVSIAGYPLDLQGTQNSVWGSSKGDPDLYGMPLRSFISKGYKNVIVAGKNVGATGPAYGSARIQPNTALAGEVIGYLLGYIEDKHELTLLTEKQMSDFHESLKKRGLTISGVQGKDKIKHLTPEQLEKLNRGSFVVK